MFLPVYFRLFDICFLCGLYQQHNSHFFFPRFTSTKKSSVDTSELNNENGISSFIQRSVSPPYLSNLYDVVYPSMSNWTVRKEELILISEIKKASIFLLAIVTNEAKINLFKFCKEFKQNIY